MARYWPPNKTTPPVVTGGDDAPVLVHVVKFVDVLTHDPDLKLMNLAPSHNVKSEAFAEKDDEDKDPRSAQVMPSADRQTFDPSQP